MSAFTEPIEALVDRASGPSLDAALHFGSAVDAARAAFADISAEMWDEVGRKLTCLEVDALVALFAACGLRDHAYLLMRAHVEGDYPDEDDHWVEGISEHDREGDKDDG